MPNARCAKSAKSAKRVNGRGDDTRGVHTAQCAKSAKSAKSPTKHEGRVNVGRDMAPRPDRGEQQRHTPREATMTAPSSMLAGPIWQNISPGHRVRPKRGRRQGEVVAVIKPLSLIHI